MPEHGTRRRFWRGCRCVSCRAAYADYWRAGHLRRAQGERKDFVDSGWAKRQIADSETLRGAAQRCGVSYETIRRIRAGKNIKLETERAILRAA